MTHVVHVALVSEIQRISSGQLARVSAALQRQVTRDFGPIWGIRATVDAFGSLDDVPLGYWPVVILDQIDDPSALGYHQDQDGQPYALVVYTQSWSLTASHETLEMLADPWGNRLIGGSSIKPDQGRVRYLIEVCDPCEAPQYAYRINGVLVSDFYTPSFFDSRESSGGRYDFTRAIQSPKTILRGGYISWLDPATGICGSRSGPRAIRSRASVTSRPRPAASSRARACASSSTERPRCPSSRKACRKGTTRSRRRAPTGARARSRRRRGPRRSGRTTGR